jgi:Protein of unknown function (DUF2829)
MEEHYKSTMDFSTALIKMRQGNKVTRKAWRNKGVYIYLFNPYCNDDMDFYEKSSLQGTFTGFIMMKTSDNSLTPWQPNHIGLLAEDWEVIE